MKEQLLHLAKGLYFRTSSKSLRQFYFRIFSALVRNRIIQTSVEGINYELDLGEVIDLALYLNRYEPDMAAALEKLCRPGFTVLDIGANIGAYTLRCAKRVGESGKVYAFEPTDYAYRKLLKNISLNRFDNIFPNQIALSDQKVLHQPIRFRSSWPTYGKPVERESVIDLDRLDDWCHLNHLERVDLIKLDVDGNEYSVIRGGQAVLTGDHPLILMEVWGPNFSDPLKNPYRALQEIGYRFYKIDNGEEYADLDDLKALVSSPEGTLLDYSINVVAQ